MTLRDFLKQQILKLQADEAQALAAANAANGAIQMCQQVLRLLDGMEAEQGQEAIPIADLEKQLGVKIEEPQPIN